MNELPTTFGKYFLTEKLAVGGMAEIYLAKLLGPSGFEKQLIIKQIHPELSGQPQFVDLFVHEAKTLVSLTHGNIVPIYELGVVEHRYFIAMEYIDGPTLSALCTAVSTAGTRIAPAVAAYVTGELLKGLDYAHRKGDGVIHRDLSPRNVMISREGEVKLVDFGIALPMDRQQTIAQKGRPEGSYPYMSPEQVRSETLTPQSDIFSTGVLMWEMLTGRPLFVREDAEKTLHAVLEDPILAPSEVVPDAGISPELDDLCLRALARDPTERFASASELLHRLNRYLYSQETMVGPAVLSRLVARHCPPVVHRDPSADDDGSEPGDGTPPPGGHTVPISRGKRRAQTQSFATNVAFQTEVLSRATPLFPIQALTDEDLDAIAAGGTGDDETPTDDHPPAANDHAAPVPPPRRGWIAGALLLVVALAASGIYLARGGSGGAARTFDAAPPPADGAVAMVATADAAPPDAAPADAGVPDAAPRAVHHRPDAGPPRAPGVLKVGANPWGHVYVDGKQIGRTPFQGPVPAGRHTVRVRFPVNGHEQEKRFHIDVRPGQTVDLGLVDFSGG